MQNLGLRCDSERLYDIYQYLVLQSFTRHFSHSVDKRVIYLLTWDYSWYFQVHVAFEKHSVCGSISLYDLNESHLQI